jgi:hypothetical protein
MLLVFPLAINRRRNGRKKSANVFEDRDYSACSGMLA